MIFKIKAKTVLKPEDIDYAIEEYITSTPTKFNSYLNKIDEILIHEKNS